MKGKFLKKARIASAVMLATAGMSIGTAQADSLLAPLVVIDQDGAGLDTYFAMKVRGSGVANAQMGVVNQLHYTYIRKRAGGNGSVGGFANDADDLFQYRNTHGCTVENNFGSTSPYDVVVQSAHRNDGLAIPGFGSNVVVGDTSLPNGYALAAGEDFYGMMIIDDESNIGGPVFQNEGEFSGFAYIVDRVNGEVFDYKLLNNHRSKVSGDFSAGFIAKTSIDLQWLPVDGGIPYGAIDATPNGESTVWYSAVVGAGMTDAAELSGGWNQSVMFTQTDQPGTVSVLPITAGPGAYNHDETVTSGPRNMGVTCLGMFDRNDFLLPLQVNDTANGGWKRNHIVVTSAPTAFGSAAAGAITYRFDNTFFPFSLGQEWTAMQVETSGHLGTGALGAHPNRPY